jgi:type I restriction enzyme S subunit
MSDGFVNHPLYSALKNGETSEVNTLLMKGFAKIHIPVPSPEKQDRIVAILNKFDVLTNSISEGLPREIALRQKQYEYYRDLLLSFPKPEEVAA